jgi:hypothetical protein
MSGFEFVRSNPDIPRSNLKRGMSRSDKDFWKPGFARSNRDLANSNLGKPLCGSGIAKDFYDYPC